MLLAITSPLLALPNTKIGRITGNAEDIVRIIADHETRNFQLGVVLIVIAITSWIIGLELVNSVLKGDEYKKPFMFAWITGSFFMMNFTPDIWRWMCRRIRGAVQEAATPPAPPATTSPATLSGHTASESDPLLLAAAAEKDFEGPQELSRGEVGLLALQIALIYLLYNVFVMYALQFTSASNATVLGSTTSVFTLVVGSMLKIDRYSTKKVICIFVSLSGVFLINLSETASKPTGGGKFAPKDPVLGNLLAILGAFMYALYLIIMKVKCGGSRSTNERVLFGWVGVFTFLLGPPVLAFVHYQGIETFDFPPPNNQILALVLINGAFSVISDYTTILAMLLTSPLVTSLSLTSSIPITIFVDYIIKITQGGGSGNNGGDNISSYIYFFGIASILTSVILVNINLTTENELISEVIEEALEDAIREDEVLSPILSPLLSPKSPFAINGGSAQNPRLRTVNFQTVLTSFSPKHAPVAPNSATGTIPGFELPHSQIEGFESISAATDPDYVEPGQFVISGGENHHYRVKNVYTLHQP